MNSVKFSAGIVIERIYGHVDTRINESIQGHITWELAKRYVKHWRHVDTYHTWEALETAERDGSLRLHRWRKPTPDYNHLSRHGTYQAKYIMYLKRQYCSKRLAQQQRRLNLWEQVKAINFRLALRFSIRTPRTSRVGSLCLRTWHWKRWYFKNITLAFLKIAILYQTFIKRLC